MAPKLSAKEREILARQRRLAATLKPPTSADASQQPPAGAAKKAPPPPPSRPTLRRPQQQQQQPLAAARASQYLKKNAVAASSPSPPPSSITNNNSTANFLSKFGMKVPTGAEKKVNSNNSKTSGNGAAPSAAIDLTQDDSKGAAATSSGLARPIRPSIKNKNKQRAAALLAAAQKQKDDEAKAASLTASESSSPLPAVAKKKSATSGALAQLVQNLNTTQSSSEEAAVFATIEPEDFWKHLRDWDFCAQYLQQQNQSNHRPQPKNEKDRNDKDKKEPDANTILTTRPLPNMFLSAKQYIALWAPLCMAECRAQLLQEVASKRQHPIPVQVEVMQDSFRTSKSKTTDKPWDAATATEFIDTSIHVKINPLHPRGGGSDSVMTNDLCLLLQYDDFFQRPSAMNAKALVGHAEVTRHRGLQNLICKVSKRKWAQLGQAQMHLVILGANVTAWREFTALTQVATLPLKRFLLGEHLESAEARRQQKKLSSSNSTEQLVERMGGSEALGKGFADYCAKKFNVSQLTAIAASAHEYGEGGFTLIKGPPGTGKTTTLVAVLNSLHIRQYNKYYAEVRRIAAQSSGSRQNALQFARKAKPRLLVCAPSNAAVDNVILKIMQDGFIDGQGQRYNPSMIRVGVGQSAAVRAVALETKVDSIVGENVDVTRLDASIGAYRVEVARITQDMHQLRQRIQAMAAACPWPLSRDWEIRIDESVADESNGNVGRVYFVNHRDKSTTYEVPPPPEPDETQFPASSMPEYRAYVSRIVKLVESYFTVKTHLERCTLVKAGFDANANSLDVRINLETHVLNDVHIVMTTLGTAGNRAFDQTDKFEVVVVDEAAQSVEPATLAALQLGSRHAVLVGDPQQLPATIFNVSGRHSKYDRSLFARLEEAGQAVYMLKEQYRMHPEISHFPRHIFYGGTLLDGPNVVSPTYGNRLRAVLNCAVPQFKPFTILDLDSFEERGGTSLSNQQEAQLAVYLYLQLREFARELCTESKVAVITPYAQQVHLLRRLFADALGQERYESLVEINSVDAFQGREANIVVFSAVRAAGSSGIGFLSDVRRMNVALTRAKHFLFVLCRCESIVVNPYWRDLVQHARDTQAVLKVQKVGGSRHQPVFSSPIQWHVEEGIGDHNMHNNRGGGGRRRLPPPPPPRRPSPAGGMPSGRGYNTAAAAGNESGGGPPPPPPPPPPPNKRPLPQDDEEEEGEEPEKAAAAAPATEAPLTYTESTPTLLEPARKPVDPRRQRQQPPPKPDAMPKIKRARQS